MPDAKTARLLRNVQWVACLSEGEALACIRDYRAARDTQNSDLLRWGGGEAVTHYGGPAAVIARAVVMRQTLRDMRERQAAYEAREAAILAR